MLRHTPALLRGSGGALVDAKSSAQKHTPLPFDVVHIACTGVGAPRKRDKVTWQNGGWCPKRFLKERPYFVSRFRDLSQYERESAYNIMRCRSQRHRFAHLVGGSGLIPGHF